MSNEVKIEDAPEYDPNAEPDVNPVEEAPEFDPNAEPEIKE